MATIFRRQGREKGYWLIRYTDHDGSRRERSSKTTDRRAAQRIANELEAAAALRREGVIDPRADRLATADRIPAERHVADFAKHLGAKGDTARHVQEAEAQVLRLLVLANAGRLSEVTPAKVQGALATLRGKGKSARTCNKALGAIKAWWRWLVREGRVAEDVLAHLRGFNADQDRRRERRALTAEELSKLVQAAQDGPRLHGLEGRDRAVLYLLASNTGFRASELASLTPESFRLEDDPPTVTVAAAYSKRRKTDAQPIRRDLAAVLQPWLADRPKGRPVFPVRALAEKTARMVRADLKAAELSDHDDKGRCVDFHALRHSFISHLVSSGVSVKAAQELARHSTPLLTIGRYAHTQQGELAAALDNLPPVPPLASTPAADSITTSGLSGCRPAAPERHHFRHLPAHDRAPAGASPSETAPRVPGANVRRKPPRPAHLRKPARPPARGSEKWALQDSNLGPTDYESAALTD